MIFIVELSITPSYFGGVIFPGNMMDSNTTVTL